VITFPHLAAAIGVTLLHHIDSLLVVLSVKPLGFVNAATAV